MVVRAPQHLEQVRLSGRPQQGYVAYVQLGHRQHGDRALRGPRRACRESLHEHGAALLQVTGTLRCPGAGFRSAAMAPRPATATAPDRALPHRRRPGTRVQPNYSSRQRSQLRKDCGDVDRPRRSGTYEGHTGDAATSHRQFPAASTGAGAQLAEPRRSWPRRLALPGRSTGCPTRRKPAGHDHSPHGRARLGQAGPSASWVEAANASGPCSAAAGSIHMTCQPWPSRSKKLREYMKP